MDPSGVEVLVIAGDLAVGHGIGPALDRFCERYESATVVYVHGNHEAYGSTRPEVVEITREACTRHSNLRWLDAGLVELQGQRILGAPLWFRRPLDESTKVAMNDFLEIRDFETWVYDENARALDFFERELRRGDVVVTHHLPVEAAVAPQWKGSPLNAFFVCDVEPLLRERAPAVWIHGHTHDSVDLRLGSTRVLCNPFGYARYELNRAFADAAIVEV